jgi:hypothetical protein
MSIRLKVTFNKLYVRDNGEWPGRGEISWNMSVDNQHVDSGSSSKVSDGQTILITDSILVTKSPDAELTVLATVSEDDGFLKGADDTRTLRQTFTEADNWGIGSHTFRLVDGKHLDVTMYYAIAEA